MEPKNEQKPVVNQVPAGATMSHHQPEVGPQGRPILSFGEAVKICFKKYFDFTGRARRSEYWWFVLFICLVRMVCSFIDSILIFAVDMKFMEAAFSVLLFIPSMAVVFRRLHDIGRSGWWSGVSYILVAISILSVLFMAGFDFGVLMDNESMFRTLSGTQRMIALLPFIGGVVLCVIVFVFSLFDSERGENKYGPSPKYPGD